MAALLRGLNGGHEVTAERFEGDDFGQRTVGYICGLATFASHVYTLLKCATSSYTTRSLWLIQAKADAYIKEQLTNDLPKASLQQTLLPSTQRPALSPLLKRGFLECRAQKQDY